MDPLVVDLADLIQSISDNQKHECCNRHWGWLMAAVKVSIAMQKQILELHSKGIKSRQIAKILKVEMAKEKDRDHQVFKVSWSMKIRNQESVVISVFNSFE